MLAGGDANPRGGAGGGAGGNVGGAPGGGRGFGRGGGGGLVEWTHDAKFYQFWDDGSEDGKFTISNVRPGTYTLHAFADGVLGEYTNLNITVEAGKTLDLGKLDWKPVRYGKQIWEIGYPDRTGGKFFKGDGSNYWLWGWCVRYGNLFPNDITYTIGQSDYHKDWFFEQVPHATLRRLEKSRRQRPVEPALRLGQGRVPHRLSSNQHPRALGYLRPGPRHHLDHQIQHGPTTQRPGRSPRRARGRRRRPQRRIGVTVNGQSAGAIRPTSTDALRYNTDKSVWQERTLTFDATLMKQGANEMQLTVPAGDLTTGVVYDYLRLELNEDYKPGTAP